MKPYLVYFESANYAGYGEHRIVWAEDEDGAHDQALTLAEEYYYDEDADQILLDFGDDFEEPYGNVVSVDVYYPGHDSWQFRKTFEGWDEKLETFWK